MYASPEKNSKEKELKFSFLSDSDENPAEGAGHCSICMKTMRINANECPFFASERRRIFECSDCHQPASDASGSLPEPRWR